MNRIASVVPLIPTIVALHGFHRMPLHDNAGNYVGELPDAHPPVLSEAPERDGNDITSAMVSTSVLSDVTTHHTRTQFLTTRALMFPRVVTVSLSCTLHIWAKIKVAR